MHHSHRAVKALVGRYEPHLYQLGFGGAMGIASGYAMKQIGKAAAMIIGTAFISLQVAAYYGYVEVKWKKIRDDVVPSGASAKKVGFEVFVGNLLCPRH